MPPAPDGCDAGLIVMPPTKKAFEFGDEPDRFISVKRGIRRQKRPAGAPLSGRDLLCGKDGSRRSLAIDMG